MKLTSEKLIHGIANLIDPYDSGDALEILHNEFQFTDDEIREMGFDYLFPEEEPEPDETPKKTFMIHVVETWEGYFPVEAADEEEAYDLACDLEYNSDELECEDRKYYAYEERSENE